MSKIIIVGTAYPYRGGIAAFNERLALQFQEEGDEVEIWTFTVQYPNFLFPGKTQYSVDPAPESLKIKRIVNSVNPFNWIKVGRMLRKVNADLVVMRYWIPLMAPSHGCIARIARRNKNTRLVCVLDNVVPHEKRLGDKMLTSFFARSVDGFVAMSQPVMNDILRFDQKKPKALCPHPLYDNFGAKVSRDEALRFLNLSADTRYMLFFGIIRDYKGLDLLLKAFADTRFKELNVKLMVAGEFYNNAEQYHQLENQLGLEDRVIWDSRFVADSEVKYYFNAADIVVQPYKSATQSGVTQIAYHFERPMLVTDVGGLKEIVPDGKIGYVTEVDVDKIADALIDFFTNHREEEFVANVAIEKQKYSWSRMSSTIKNVLK